MTPFSYTRAVDLKQALDGISAKPSSKFLGGGTNLVDLMKMGVETPSTVVDISRLPLASIDELPNGKGVRIGALARNSAVADHPLIAQRYPLLRDALLAGASPQLRNMATVGGNLLQRTRCYYFYDPAFPACNKRKPGSGCGALHGFNRIHAILGQSDQCIATHPSDMCVAMAALEAVVRVSGPRGERVIPFDRFHTLPGNSPQKETTLAPDEIITGVDLPASASVAKSHYLKVRDRESYAFALVSVAVVCESSNDVIKRVRMALGGVAHKPWRALAVEKALQGKIADESTFSAAAEAELARAHGYQFNTFKIELARRSIVRALQQVTAVA